MKKAGVVIKENYRTWLAWIVAAIASYIIASYLVIGAAWLVHAYVPGVGMVGTIESLWLRVAVSLVALLLLMGMPKLLKIRLPDIRVIGLHRMLLWRDVAISIAGMVVYAALAMIAFTLAAQLPFFNPAEQQDLGRTSLYGLEGIWAFLALVVAVPVVEEALFRGLLYGKLRQAHLSYWPAAIVVSLLFAIAHGQLNVAIDVFCLSIVASYLRELTGSIWAGILLHMAKNALAFFTVYTVLYAVGG